MRLNVKGQGYYCPHPVGTWLHCEFDPNSEWPGTTWFRYKEATYLVSSGDNFKTLTNCGENSHVLTVEEMPRHSHTGNGGTNWNVEVSNNADSGNFIGSSGIAWIENAFVHVGGSQPHNNMPYSVCVPLWRRTAWKN